jgi:hypothetical protein
MEIELREFVQLGSRRLPKIEKGRRSTKRHTGHEVTLREPRPAGSNATRESATASGSFVSLQEGNMNTQQQPHWMNPNWFKTSAQSPALSTQTSESRLREAASRLYGDGQGAEQSAEHFVKGREGTRDEVMGESPYEYLDRIGALGSVHIEHPALPELREASGAPEARNAEARMAEAFQRMGMSSGEAAQAARGRGDRSW